MHSIEFIFVKKQCLRLYEKIEIILYHSTTYKSVVEAAAVLTEEPHVIGIIDVQ